MTKTSSPQRTLEYQGDGPLSSVTTSTRIALLTAACAGGCNAGYVAEQAWGHFRLLSQRKPIVRVLRSEKLRPRWRDNLQLVLLTRDYASDVLGLARTGSYTQLVETPGDQPLAYNLSAAPKDALTPTVWSFPIVGSLPYLGFFRRNRGLEMQHELQRQGLDTYLRPVSAYSSLGWFHDPIYSSLLSAKPWRLIEVVLHETTHSTIFLRGEVAFNESLAVLVGQQGTLNLLARLYGPTSPQVQRARTAFARSRRFARLISRLVVRLRRLYAQPISRAAKVRARERHFSWAKRRYKEMFGTDAEMNHFLEQPLNNAVVLSFGRYLRNLRFHLAVYRCLGRDLAALVALYRHAQQFPSPLAYAAMRCRLTPELPQQM